jgi:Zn-dependent peptidase ImmA (M78 family)
MAILRRPILTQNVDSDTRNDGARQSPKDVLKKASEHGLKVLPVDIVGIIKLYNLVLCREPMDDEISGYLERRGHTWVVGVNSLHHPRRQRFSIAHELAHFLLHSSSQHEFVDKTYLRYQDEATDPMEREADQFAGELLMPENAFRELVTQGITSVTDLSDRFDTSSVAIRYRARQLGFTKAGQ